MLETSPRYILSRKVYSKTQKSNLHPMSTLKSQTYCHDNLTYLHKTYAQWKRGKMIQVTWMREAYTWHNWDACWKSFYINNFSLLWAWIAKYWDCLSFMWSVFDLRIKYLFMKDDSAQYGYTNTQHIMQITWISMILKFMTTQECF